MILFGLLVNKLLQEKGLIVAYKDVQTVVKTVRLQNIIVIIKRIIIEIILFEKNKIVKLFYFYNTLIYYITLSSMLTGFNNFIFIN